MRRLAGPDLQMSEETKLSALHDVQRFVIDAFVEWSINTDNEVDVLVRWRGHDDEDEQTWEPLEQLVADVPKMIEAYVKADGHHQLVNAHRKCVQTLRQQQRRNATTGK